MKKPLLLPTGAPGAAFSLEAASPDVSFPASWLWLMDEAVPAWVKTAYSPRESWKNKPFTAEDARFFSKGVNELSALFTDERAKKMPGYFTHPKYRSAYLLYFLPLQAAKFMTVLDLHEGALDAALEHATKTGTFRMADLGAGPGTASISLLLKLMDPKLGLPRELPFRIELDWFDLNAQIMADGKALVETLASHFPRLRGRVDVRTHAVPWTKAATLLKLPTSLMCIGNALNEASGPETDTRHPHWAGLWRTLLAKASGGGMLLLEPAMRHSAQKLSRIRDHVFTEGALEASPGAIWGPCLHAGACPLAEGRDWCHFSFPAEIPGQWFRKFSEGLGSERQWVKFCYVWFAASDSPAPEPRANLRRVISDDLRGREARGPRARGPAEVLLCEPEQPLKATVQFSAAIGGVYRGDLVAEKRPVRR